MSRTSHTLIAAMPTVLDFTGSKIRAAGWHGHTKGWHSFAISVHNFQGRIFLQGSQALDPDDADWFALPCPAPYDALPYIEYPRPIPPPSPGRSPLGPPPFGPQRNPNLRNGETSTIGFSLRINCLWLRAMIKRDWTNPRSGSRVSRRRPSHDNKCAGCHRRGLDHPAVASYNRRGLREKVIGRISQKGGS